MTLKQKILAKIRAWIDRRLPRDVLRITVSGITENDGDGSRVLPLISITHMEQILQCKYTGGTSSFVFKGNVLIVFSTEHLTP